MLVLQAIAMIGAGYALWRWSDPSGAPFVTLSAAQVLWGMALGAGMAFAAWTGFRMFPRIADTLVRMQAKPYGFLGGTLGWPAITVISLCAGMGEEALFRGGIQTWLGHHIGVPAAIALSSAAFAAIHFARPVITAIIFVIGALFGIIYWQTGSLLMVMIGHALYDVWALRYLLNEFRRLGLVGGPLANGSLDS